jgi:Holliday junction resolvase
LTNYETGRRLEYRIRNMFRKNGYFVIRAAQSKPIDLVCIRDGKTVLIECKSGRSWLGPSRKNELLELSKLAGAPIIVARRKKNRKIELTYLKNGKAFVIKTLIPVVKESTSVAKRVFEGPDLFKHTQPAEHQVTVS